MRGCAANRCGWGRKRGIIASASYEARKFGIYTPMPTMARRALPQTDPAARRLREIRALLASDVSYAYDFTPDVEIGSD
jgi:nucleotidyltransferase/DNA polymerase involved in DNA repair